MSHCTRRKLRRTGPLALASAAGRGFTLMEMVVAVAAVAVISVGLAAIFDAVGKTVSGGRRVSVLNTYAGLMEARLRRDFERMSREGFLMVRQQWANDGVGRLAVPVSDAQRQADWRARRVDEILFFTKGRAESARLPVGIDQSAGTPLIATGEASRVYYGHGQRVGASNAAYSIPSIGDLNPPVVSGEPVVALGVPFVADPSQNPNYYAGGWTLLRHETVLARPRASAGAAGDFRGLLGTNQPPLGDPSSLDSDVQVAGQPAAPAIFRSHNRWFPGGAGAPLPSWMHPASPNPASMLTPRFASGLIDIATTDLEEIRWWVTSGTLLPGRIEDPATPATLIYPNRRMASAVVAFTSNPPPLTQRVLGLNPIDWQHAWMDDAWPTQSAVLPAGNTPEYNPAPSAVPGTANAIDPSGARLRYEPQSPDLFGEIAAGNLYGRADQLLLTASNFVPRCSEFIVEWSFGDTDPNFANSEPVWYGLPRNPGAVAETYPYPYSSQGRGNWVVHTRPLRVNGANALATVSDRLVYGYSPDESALVLTSFFGYTDPSLPSTSDADSDGQIDHLSPLRPQPWPWPRLIRVTIVLSDPQDPTIESTFQYIFTTPTDPGSN